MLISCRGGAMHGGVSCPLNSPHTFLSMSELGLGLINEMYDNVISLIE